jgi:hypothetical protein
MRPEAVEARRLRADSERLRFCAYELVITQGARLVKCSETFKLGNKVWSGPSGVCRFKIDRSYVVPASAQEDWCEESP